MNFKEDIKPISYFKANAAQVIAKLAETHRPMIITQNGEASAVIQDIESYTKLQNALNLLKLVAQGEKDFEAGRTIPQKEVFAKLDAIVKQRS